MSIKIAGWRLLKYEIVAERKKSVNYYDRVIKFPIYYLIHLFIFKMIIIDLIIYSSLFNCSMHDLIISVKRNPYDHISVNLL